MNFKVLSNPKNSMILLFWSCVWLPEWGRMSQGRDVFVCICECACEEKAAKVHSFKAWSWNNLGYRMTFAKEIEVDSWWWQEKSSCLRLRHLWCRERGWKSVSWWAHCTQGEQLPTIQPCPCRSTAADGTLPSIDRPRTVSSVQIWSKLC